MFLYLLTFLLGGYSMFGAWMCVHWWDEMRDECGVLVATLFCLPVGVAFWPFIMGNTGSGSSDRQHLRPARKRAGSKTARAELARMAKAERDEEAAVEVLEASAEHRQTMAALHERRRKAEEIA